VDKKQLAVVDVQDKVRQALEGDEDIAKTAAISEPIFDEIEKIIINEATGTQDAADLKRSLALARKDLNKQKREYSGPLNKAAKVVTAYFKQYIAENDKYKAIIDKKINDHLNDQRAKEALKVAEITSRLDDDDAKIVREAFQRSRQQKRSESGNRVYQKKTKKWLIENESLIPREYLIPSSTKIGKAVNNGVHVKGVRVYYKITSEGRHTEQ